MNNEDELLFYPEVGDKVRDDLTQEIRTVIRISTDEFGNMGYWLDSDYLAGGRHPWEISPLLEPEVCIESSDCIDQLLTDMDNSKETQDILKKLVPDEIKLK